MRANIKNMVQVVNNNEGWTIIGWHRQGVQHHQGEAEDQVVSLHTEGHITLLMPSNYETLLRSDYTNFIIKTPELYSDDNSDSDSTNKNNNDGSSRVQNVAEVEVDEVLKTRNNNQHTEKPKKKGHVINMLQFDLMIQSQKPFNLCMSQSH